MRYTIDLSKYEEDASSNMIRLHVIDENGQVVLSGLHDCPEQLDTTPHYGAEHALTNPPPSVYRDVFVAAAQALYFAGVDLPPEFDHDTDSVLQLNAEMLTNDGSPMLEFTL